MVRAVSGVYTRQRKKKLFKLAKGYKFGKKNLYRIVKEQLFKSLKYSYRHRKERKREFRRLWITRINAAVRPYGLSYSEFMHALKNKNILINRKILSEIAIQDNPTFSYIVNYVKS
jgi:large subunit ribosomal protein L20